MKNSLLALTAAFVLSACPDTKVPKAPPKVPEPKAVAAVQVSQHKGQSWIAERAPHAAPWH